MSDQWHDGEMCCILNAHYLKKIEFKWYFGCAKYLNKGKKKMIIQIHTIMKGNFIMETRFLESRTLTCYSSCSIIFARVFIV